MRWMPSLPFCQYFCCTQQQNIYCGHRRIAFDQFVSALAVIAERRRVTLADVVRDVLACEAPALNGTTKADYVKFHDDKVRTQRCTYAGEAHCQLVMLHDVQLALV